MFPNKIVSCLLNLLLAAQALNQIAKKKHDFKDDSLGEIPGAYGPYFIRLDVPGQKGIGIHGTHDNNSLGTRASEGCIRLKNEDLEALVKRINTTSIVIITPGQQDVNVNNDTIKIKEVKKETIVRKDASVKVKSNTTEKNKQNTMSANGINTLIPKNIKPKQTPKSK